MSDNNLPDVHALDRDIPAGKVLLAEARQIGPNDPRPVRAILDTKTGWGRAHVRIEAVTAGWACAGSMTRRSLSSSRAVRPNAA
jgi:hypothetical protein